MINILVLGHKGMLGHMVVKYLQSQEMDVVKFIGRFPEDQKTLLRKYASSEYKKYLKQHHPNIKIEDHA